MKFETDNNIILFDKPIGKTSFDIVKIIRKYSKIKKVGHAGTLDPLATGLLVLCTGKCTKEISKIQQCEKEYTGTIVIGATRPSYDMETEIDHYFETKNIKPEHIYKAFETFKGFIEQVPPAFSAVKINGKRAYESARKGVEVKIEPRKVEIKDIEVTKIKNLEVDFRVVCSKGTYIRTLANDIGKKLNNGAYLKALRRTRIGQFHVENAYKIEEFIYNENLLNQ
ncbi:MAG: tRNA pseudouridine(55) synthase TruB [Bacteroidetes bacterium]|nr:tRNA pseudouridine(55) synthase TruB [Bacteroidota bacterium]